MRQEAAGGDPARSSREIARPRRTFLTYVSVLMSVYPFPGLRAHSFPSLAQVVRRHFQQTW